MGVGSGVFPRFPAAASSRGRGPSAKTTAHTFGSRTGRKLLVRKRTSASRTCEPATSCRDLVNPCCYPENSGPICCLLAYALPIVSGIHAPRLLNKEDSLMPHEIVAVARTLCLLCVVLAAFELGEISVSFTGSQLAWMVVIGIILALVVLSFELLRAIWTTAGRD